jgi:hypothetical protein
MPIGGSPPDVPRRLPERHGARRGRRRGHPVMAGPLEQRQYILQRRRGQGGDERLAILFARVQERLELLGMTMGLPGSPGLPRV